MYNSCRAAAGNSNNNNVNGLESEGAISCLDLPGSSLSADIFEDDEEPEELDPSYLYPAHWWPKTPVRKL